ncbi:hypothetical protein Xmau_00280 [Xenorhabdus mauleonii]|uniref:Uncharacterized protein n=1 Tax=Xenorhabdus mauleonii TaxID=351675 RepID=A0A1I3XVX2_9GAMM|nr:hypothetical protein Xmau_00280 [Xenorhabdus mauleonii]SFK23662.1 hypothetical protein SAMN05421680_13922 [Xenorhabdus mauleonii]
MPVPKLDEVFRELKNYKNPDNTPVLQEITLPNNGVRTLLISFADINVRKNFIKKVRLSSFSGGRGTNTLSAILHQLGFEPTIPVLRPQPQLEFRLTDHAGYNVTINSYQNIILPSFTQEESNYINRFAERWSKGKYQNVRDSLSNYQSPAPSPTSSLFSRQESHSTLRSLLNKSPSPSRSPQPSTSGIQRYSPTQVSRPTRIQRSQQSVNTTYDPYARPPGAPRPLSRPQTRYEPQSSIYSQRSPTYKEWFDEDDESWM